VVLAQGQSPLAVWQLTVAWRRANCQRQSTVAGGDSQVSATQRCVACRRAKEPSSLAKSVAVKPLESGTGEVSLQPGEACTGDWKVDCTD
jgi:hypothetical protein